MQLSEIKNDLATINYSPEINRLMLGDFILIEDTNQSILSQIISIEATMEDDVNSAMLKFLLSIDKEANLTQYTGYVPAKNASLILINPEEIIQLIKSNEKNIFLGNLAAYSNISVELSLDFLRKRTYIQVDFVENKLQIVKSIIRGLENHNRKTLLFDFQGLYEGLSLPTVTLGYNFKLPLNYEALCYIAEEELNDFSNDNKAVIQGILIEVENYVKTTKEEFIPFDTLISVLDAQYEESPMPELLLLKNKLLKYQQQGLFAQEKSEFDFLNSFLKDAKNFKFDLSELPEQWHKIAFISILHIIKTKCYLITDFTDTNSNNTIIKRLYEKTEIKPIVISSYNYKYQLQLKAMSKNLILFKPIQKVNDFAGYTSFLNILSQDTFIIWGEQTLYIPLILKTQSTIESEAKLERILPSKSKTSFDEPAAEEEEILTDSEAQNVDSENNDNKEPELQEIMPAEIMDYSPTDVVSDTNSINDIDEFSTPEQDEPTVEYDDYLPENDMPNSNDMDFFFDEEDTTVIEPQPNTEEQISGEIINETSIEETSEISEIPQENLMADNTVIDFDDVSLDEQLNEQTNYNPDTTSDFIEVNELETESDNAVAVEYEEETVIKTTETQTEQIAHEKIPEPAVEIKSPPVSVYNSNVAPQFDTKFAQGTYVHHPKYGRGVVEKVIQYGSKELCLIIFDNEGRKLLDPNIAELKQI